CISWHSFAQPTELPRDCLRANNNHGGSANPEGEGARWQVAVGARRRLLTAEGAVGVGGTVNKRFFGAAPRIRKAGLRTVRSRRTVNKRCFPATADAAPLRRRLGNDAACG